VVGGAARVRVGRRMVRERRVVSMMAEVMVLDVCCCARVVFDGDDLGDGRVCTMVLELLLMALEIDKKLHRRSPDPRTSLYAPRFINPFILSSQPNILPNHPMNPEPHSPLSLAV
jgi:hypothetical protein